jgi:hypothetical protein
LIFSLWDAVFEVLKESAEREDEVVENMIALFQIEVVALLEHSSVNLDDLLFDQPHHLDRHEIQHILAVLVYHFIDLHRIVDVHFVHRFADVAQQQGVVSTNTRRQHFVKFEKIV